MIDILLFQHKTDPIKHIGTHGQVELIDVMPRVSYDDTITTCDYAIAEMARTSYGGVKRNNDETLIRYLMRHNHTSPFEGVSFKFFLKAPIFVFRQIMRTRTAKINEFSGRYAEMPDEFDFFIEDDIRVPHSTNKQMSEGIADKDVAKQFCDHQKEVAKIAYSFYKESLENGIPKEQARTLLPLNLYSQLYFKIDLHNLLHFLSLRMDNHAQKETRDYANAMYELIEPLVPITIQAWEDYHPLRGAIKLTRLEVEAIKNKTKIISSNNKREIDEWNEKKKDLGL